MELKLPKHQPELPPEQIIDNIDAAVIPLQQQRRKLNRMAFLFITTGILLTVAITVYFYVNYNSIVLWGGPALLVGGIFGFGCMRLRDSLDLQVQALQMARHEMQKKLAKNE